MSPLEEACMRKILIVAFALGMGLALGSAWAASPKDFADCDQSGISTVAWRLVPG